MFQHVGRLLLYHKLSCAFRNRIRTKVTFPGRPAIGRLVMSGAIVLYSFCSDPDKLLMNSLLPASLVALINYYTLLWRSPCVSISLLLFAGQSRVLTAWYKAFKWLQRVVLQQGSELSRLARLGEDVVEESEVEDDPDRSEGDDEIRLLRDQSAREQRRNVYAKWRTGEQTTRGCNQSFADENDFRWFLLPDYSIGHSHALEVSTLAFIHNRLQITMTD